MFMRIVAENLGIRLISEVRKRNFILLYSMLLKLIGAINDIKYELLAISHVRGRGGAQHLRSKMGVECSEKKKLTLSND